MFSTFIHWITCSNFFCSRISYNKYNFIWKRNLPIVFAVAAAVAVVAPTFGQRLAMDLFAMMERFGPTVSME